MQKMLNVVKSDLINDSNIALMVHSQPVSSSVVLVHKHTVGSVTARSVEGDGVFLTDDTPKKAIVPVDG